MISSFSFRRAWERQVVYAFAVMSIRFKPDIPKNETRDEGRRVVPESANLRLRLRSGDSEAYEGSNGKREVC